MSPKHVESDLDYLALLEYNPKKAARSKIATKASKTRAYREGMIPKDVLIFVLRRLTNTMYQYPLSRVFRPIDMIHSKITYHELYDYLESVIKTYELIKGKRDRSYRRATIDSSDVTWVTRIQTCKPYIKGVLREYPQVGKWLQREIRAAKQRHHRKKAHTTQESD